MRRLLTLYALLIAIALGITNLHSQPQPGIVLPPAMLEAADNGGVLAVVMVRGTTLPAVDGDVLLRSSAVSDVLSPVIERHQLADNPVFGRLTMSPAFRILATRDQLEALAADPDVVAIRQDFLMKPERLTQSIPFIKADLAHAGGLTGEDWTIAIIDTGVSQAHPAFANKIGAVDNFGNPIGEGCWGTNLTVDSVEQVRSMCPGPLLPSGKPPMENLQPGAGAPCDLSILGTDGQPACNHGTHVAGIALGNGTLPGGGIIQGVAPDAKLMSMQVFSRILVSELCAPDPAPCIGVYGFDLDHASDRIFFVRQHFRVLRPGGIAPWHEATMIGGLNISLGSSQLFSEADLESCSASVVFASYGNLASNNNRIPSIAAAGNDGATAAVTSPACAIVSVGATQHTSLGIASFSNRWPFLSLMAPGVGINSMIPGGSSPTGAYTTMSGTSQATPHVTGAITLLRQHAPYTSVTNIVNTLKKTGQPVNDPVTGAVYRMIDLNEALKVPFRSDVLTNSLVQTNEDTTLHVPLTVNDFDTPLQNLQITVTSSSSFVVPNDAAHISVTGTGQDRVIHLTPAPNIAGTSNISVQVSDGVHDAETQPFMMTVANVNDLPTILPSSTNVQVAVGVAGQISVVLTDPDTAGANLHLTATSLNQVLLPNSNILINPLSSTSTSRTFQLTMTPAAGVEGSSTVTLSAKDSAAASAPANTLTIVFSAGTPAGAPTVSAIPAQTTNEGTPLQVPFVVGDPDTPLSSLIVTAQSSNVAVVAASGMTISGTDANRTLNITPVGTASGVTTITINVSDNSFIVQTTFQLTVVNINSTPVITGPSAATTTPGTGVTVVMTVTDGDSPGSTLSMTAESSNTTLLPNSGITVAPTTTTPTSRNFNVRMTPAGALTGQAIVTLTAMDNNNATATKTVTLTVSLANNPPIISYIPNQTTSPGVPVAVNFTISDPETPASSLTVTGTSSNPALLPNSNLQFAGAGGARSVTLTPVVNEQGSSLVSIRVSDGSQTTSGQFTLTVIGPPPDTPTSIAATASGNQVAVSWTRALGGAAPSSYLVEIGTAPGASSLPTQNTGNPDTSMLLTLPDGTYYFRVRAVNVGGISGVSPEASAVVGTANLIPGPPSNFAVTTVGAGAVFTWSPPAVGGPVGTYVIEAGTAPGFANLATLVTGNPATNYSLPFVPPGVYYVRVRGRNAVGTGGPSQDVAFSTGGVSCTVAPGSPVLFTPVVAGNAVTLSWNAPVAGDAPSSYVLLAGNAPGLSNIAAFDTGSTATSFAAPVPDGTYFVRVVARNVCGDGAPSNEMSFTVGTPAPGAPSGLSFAVGSAGLVTLNWLPPVTGGPPTGYVIDAGSAPGLSNLATVPTGSTATTFFAVAPPGTYFVRVRAVNSGGSSPASNEVAIVVP